MMVDAWLFLDPVDSGSIRLSDQLIDSTAEKNEDEGITNEKNLPNVALSIQMWAYITQIRLFIIFIHQHTTRPSWKAARGDFLVGACHCQSGIKNMNLL